MKREDMFFRPVNCAQDWMSRVVSPGDSVIDATAGNGHDSLFLANLVGSAGRVHVFDIQQQALDATRERLEQGGCMDGRIKFHLCSHALMREAAGEPPEGGEGGEGGEALKGVMFNLGYLPGGDKNLISQAAETRQALEAAADMLAPGGLLTVVCYPGHDGGDRETQAVKDFMEALPSSCWATSEVANTNTKAPAPLLLAAYKIRG